MLQEQMQKNVKNISLSQSNIENFEMSSELQAEESQDATIYNMHIAKLLNECELENDKLKNEIKQIKDKYRKVTEKYNDKLKAKNTKIKELEKLIKQVKLYFFIR